MSKTSGISPLGLDAGRHRKESHGRVAILYCECVSRVYCKGSMKSMRSWATWRVEVKNQWRVNLHTIMHLLYMNTWDISWKTDLVFRADSQSAVEFWLRNLLQKRSKGLPTLGGATTISDGQGHESYISYMCTLK